MAPPGGRRGLGPGRCEACRKHGAPVAPCRHGVGLYVHVPFCVTRCSYCTFVSTTDLAAAPRTVAAVRRELRGIARRCRRPLTSLYVGGGTPSLLDDALLRELFVAVRSGFGTCPGAEVTLEANPDDVSPSKAAFWRSLGVNRVSLGIQSFQDEVLRLLDRRHSAAQAQAAAETLRDAGFVLSVDLMLGLPAPRAAALEESLERLLELHPQHVSVYLLETDKPHRLGRRARCEPGLLPDDDVAAAQYLRTGGTLVAAGYRHYEISNFALPGFAARHNSRYWLGLPVLAAGVGAHGQSRRRRWANLGDLRTYLRAVEGGRSPIAWSRRLGGDEALKEAVMLRLRLARGVEAAALGRCGELAPEFGTALEDFLRLGLARRRGTRVRLTPRGWLVSNELLAALW